MNTLSKVLFLLDDFNYNYSPSLSVLNMTTTVRLVHISDTHGFHRHIQPVKGDVLLHTGDFTNYGTVEEIEDFNNWLGEMRRYYKYIIVIAGNHDWGDAGKGCEAGKIPPKDMYSGDYLKSKLSNCKMLCHESVVVDGISIFGSGWDCWQSAGDPDKNSSKRLTDTLPGVECCYTRFNLIPSGVDVLLTHCPPRNILDCVEGSLSPWGSSKQLTAELVKKSPKVHLFGHLHEQRGFFEKNRSDGSFSGAINYVVPPRNSVPKTKPIPKEIPCQVISNNAMLNHGRMDNSKSKLAGVPRVIIAQKTTSSGWSFSVEK